MKTREDEIMSMKSRDNLLAFGDRAHFFFDERFFSLTVPKMLMRQASRN